ncbi:DnaJ-like protein, partial [Dimargaris verticillata]
MGSFSKWGKSTKAQGSLTATDTSATSATDPTSPPGQSKCVSEPKVQPLETEYYDLLQVDTQATAAQIKSQYYKLAMKYHPDKNPDESGQEMFKRISAAYQVLSDPTRRKRYDKSGAPRSATPSDSLMTFDEFIIKCLDDHLCNKVFDDIIGRNPCVQALKEELEKERDEAKAIAGADAIEKAGDEAKGDADSVSKPIPLKNPFKLKSAAERTAAKEKRDAEKAAKIAEKEKQ